MGSSEPVFYRCEVRCRSCGGESLQDLLSLGITPLADRLRTAAQLGDPERLAPLNLVLCPKCSLVQLRQTVPPAILFGEDYPYFSSVSGTVRENARQNVEDLIRRYSLGSQHLAIEAASNDGYLLRYFQARGVQVLGIDPAKGPAARAHQDGIPTLNDFLSAALASRLRAEGVQADILIANNVLAHVPDMNDFVRAFRILLKDTGVVAVEAPYVLDLIDGREFDTIYHQHLGYFSLTAICSLFRCHGLYVRDVKRLGIHGGSLRVHASVEDAPPDPAVARMIEREAERGIASAACYQPFAASVDTIRLKLLSLLRTLKADGKRIAAYGAAAKATTLLSYCGLDGSLLDYVADLNAFKHGRYMGGNHLPIVEPEMLCRDRPDFVLLLAWNHAGEILKQESEYQRLGGRFVIPLPEPKILDPVIQ